MLDIDENRKEELRAQVGIGTLIVFIAMVLVAAIAAGVLINTAGFLQSKSEQTGQASGEQVTNRLQVLQASGIKTEQDIQTTGSTLGGIQLIVTKAPGADDIDMTGLSIQWVDNTGTYDLVHEDVFAFNSDGSAQVDGAFAHETIKDEDGSLSGEGSPVINSGDDRARLVIDVGRNDVLQDSGFAKDANSIGDAYDNHTYDYDTNDAVDEQTVKDDLTDGGDPDEFSYVYTDTTVPGIPLTDSDGGDKNYFVGTVVRSDETNSDGDRGVGLEEGETAQLRITTSSGTASTVRLAVPESLSGKTAVSL